MHVVIEHSVFYFMFFEMYSRCVVPWLGHCRQLSDHVLHKNTINISAYWYSITGRQFMADVNTTRLCSEIIYTHFGSLTAVWLVIFLQPGIKKRLRHLLFSESFLLSSLVVVLLYLKSFDTLSWNLGPYELLSSFLSSTIFYGTQKATMARLSLK